MDKNLSANDLLLPFGHDEVLINNHDASNIRVSAEESIGPEKIFKCFMDGIIEHNKTIKIQVEELTEEDKYLTAIVEDATFGQTDNLYIIALNTKPLYKC